MSAFASSTDLQARWRSLSTEEADRASVLLEDASRIIRRRWPDVDARIEAGALDAEDLLIITVGMVKRAMVRGEADGLASTQETYGPFSQAQSFSNPMGNLYLSADDRAILGPETAARAPRARSVWLS